jgi:transcriptional regulator with PAS, ATPase and Fis domain
VKRLESLSCTIQAGSQEEIRSLNTHSVDQIYLISWKFIESKDWPTLRVKLAQSGRYYLVYGSQLTTREIMRAAHDGAYDVLDEGDDASRWQQALQSSVKAQELWCQLYGGLGRVEWHNLIGSSKAMQAIRDSIKRVAPTDAAVLITGESGTGKERIAEAIHTTSGRGNFVPVNCAAIPAELLESEFFGAEKGAYTGADREKVGLVEEASGGTLFLDEIGEMSLALQPKLLRFLETRIARRVGSTKQYTCDVRVISATNRNLKQAAEAGRFRLDLYYRLSEVTIIAPSLRQRIEDIPDLAAYFMKGAAERTGKNFESLEPELIYKLQLYDWPGNVRELKQTIERLAIHYDGPVMRAAWWDVPEHSSQQDSDVYNSDVLADRFADESRRISMPQASERLPGRKEKLALAKKLLDVHGDDLSWVAAQVGIHPTTLYRWRKAGKI